MFPRRKKQFCRSTSALYVTNWCACCLRPSFSTRACSSASIMPGPRSRTGRRLQPATAALGVGLCHTGSRCRQSLRNTRSSAQPRPAPPIACCSTRAPRRKQCRGSNRRRMKVQWQVTQRQWLSFHSRRQYTNWVQRQGLSLRFGVYRALAEGAQPLCAGCRRANLFQTKRRVLPRRTGRCRLAQ
jgi:hypothetical protein